MPGGRSDGGEVNVRREQRKISWSFFYYLLGIFLSWSSSVSLFNLQSSINVENALGTTTGAAMFTVSVLSGVFLAPVAMKKFGVKTCILCGDAGMFPYILANLYPTYYTLLPAGILMAFLQSPLWPSMSFVNVMFASQYSKLSKRTKDTHVISFSSYFFTVFQSSQVFGSLLTYVILYGFDRIPPPELADISDCNSTNISCNVTTYGYSHCGVNDCQNATIIEETLNHYKPVNRVSLYVLVGVAIFLGLLACFVHGFFLPNDKAFARKLKKYDDFLLNQKESALLEDKDEELNVSDTAEDATQDIGFVQMVVNSARSIFKHAMHWKLLLLVPITLYNGLAMAFIETEATRSFASCILGVQWVGICMAMYSFWDAIFSLVYGKIGRKVGRIPLFLITMMLECGNHLYCLMWSGKPNILFSVMVVFFGFGVTDGIFQAIVNVTHIDFFPHNREVALPVWNVLVECGLVIGYSLSTAFCVRTRVYFNAAFLIVGCAGVVIADLCQRRHSSRKENLSEKEGAGHLKDMIIS